MQRKSSPVLLAAVALFVLSLVACAPVRAVRGNFVESEALKTLQPGVATKADVMAKIGTPSTTDPFDASRWIYVGERTSQRGPWAAKVEDRQVLALYFDGNDTLEKIERHDEKSGKIEVMAQRTTPTAGKQMNALQQFIGNIGKFNPGGGTGGAERSGSSR